MKIKGKYRQFIGWLTASSYLAVTLFFIGTFIPQPAHAAGATLKLSPSSGVYEVGALVDISMIVDTGGEAINAVAATLQFPADKLQVVNPAASTSFISIWVTAPTYSNTDGTVTFQGGLPNPGIKTSAGVISTITFRVKAPGPVTLKYAPSARVLKNDGQGTNILTATSTAEIVLKVPPPAGPEVSSPTHGDQNSWFNNSQIQFVWTGIEAAIGYSYIFDQSPKTIPDETSDSTATAVSVQASSDGVWFFHLRAKTETWGGVTTFPVQIDTTPPAGFSPLLDKKVITTEDIPSVRFTTTDAASGIDHFEIKVLAKDQQQSGVNTLFIEGASPFTLTKLPAGDYSVIVKAIDRAGNAIEGILNTKVISGGLPFYARVPFLQNPAIANVVLLVLGLLALALIVITLLRRLRLRSTFQHDLAALEHDAQKKSHALEKELEDLRRAQQLVDQNISTIPNSQWSSPPMVHVAPTIIEPVMPPRQNVLPPTPPQPPEPITLPPQ